MLGAAGIDFESGDRRIDERRWRPRCRGAGPRRSRAGAGRGQGTSGCAMRPGPAWYSGSELAGGRSMIAARMTMAGRAGRRPRIAAPSRAKAMELHAAAGACARQCAALAATPMRPALRIRRPFRQRFHRDPISPPNGPEVAQAASTCYIGGAPWACSWPTASRATTFTVLGCLYCLCRCLARPRGLAELPLRRLSPTR